MTLLCSGHHTALHDGLLVIQGKARYGIQVHWVYGAPLPIGLTAEARQAMIAQRIAEIFGGMLPNTDPSAETREYTRPTWDSGPVEVT